MVILGERVKMLREQLKMTQVKLAEDSYLTQATISRIEGGKIEELKSEALVNLAKALETTVDYLVGKTTKMVPDEKEFSDPIARHVFRGWEKLSPGSRKKLQEYFDLLEKSERGKNRK